MGKESPIVSVIIVTNNHKKFLSDCFDSILQQSERKLEVIVVDNNSDDGTVGIVKKKYPSFKLIVREKKNGFAANNNLAIRQSKGQFVFLLNPDTKLSPNTIENLLAFMCSHPEAGICGAKLLFPDGSLQYSARRFPTILSGLIRRTPLRLFFKKSQINKKHLNYGLDYTRPHEVDWLLGACLFIRKRTIEEVGLLDEDYFLYVEDIDYCSRVWRKGWKVWYVPNAVMIHFHQAESDRNFFSKKNYHHIASMIRYMKKHLMRRYNELSNSLS